MEQFFEFAEKMENPLQALVSCAPKGEESCMSLVLSMVVVVCVCVCFRRCVCESVRSDVAEEPSLCNAVSEQTEKFA